MISLEKPAERPQDYQGKYWKVDVEFLYLSVFADWKFTNLNFLFENVMGWNILHKHGIERTLRMWLLAHLWEIKSRRNITNPHTSNIFQCVNSFST